MMYHTPLSPVLYAYLKNSLHDLGEHTCAIHHGVRFLAGCEPQAVLPLRCALYDMKS